MDRSSAGLPTMHEHAEGEAEWPPPSVDATHLTTVHADQPRGRPTDRSLRRPSAVHATDSHARLGADDEDNNNNRDANASANGNGNDNGNGNGNHNDTAVAPFTAPSSFNLTRDKASTGSSPRPARSPAPLTASPSSSPSAARHRSQSSAAVLALHLHQRSDTSSSASSSAVGPSSPSYYSTSATGVWDSPLSFGGGAGGAGGLKSPSVESPPTSSSPVRTVRSSSLYPHSSAAPRAGREPSLSRYGGLLSPDRLANLSLWPKPGHGDPTSPMTDADLLAEQQAQQQQLYGGGGGSGPGAGARAFGAPGLSPASLGSSDTGSSPRFNRLMALSSAAATTTTAGVGEVPRRDSSADRSHTAVGFSGFEDFQTGFGSGPFFEVNPESRRHSIAAPPIAHGAKNAVGFSLPGGGAAPGGYFSGSLGQPPPRTSVGGFFGGGGTRTTGGLAISDDDLASDFSSLRFDLAQDDLAGDAGEERGRGERVEPVLRVPTTAASGAHPASMPIHGSSALRDYGADEYGGPGALYSRTASHLHQLRARFGEQSSPPPPSPPVSPSSYWMPRPKSRAQSFAGASGTVGVSASGLAVGSGRLGDGGEREQSPQGRQLLSPTTTTFDTSAPAISQVHHPPGQGVGVIGSQSVLGPGRSRSESYPAGVGLTAGASRHALDPVRGGQSYDVPSSPLQSFAPQRLPPPVGLPPPSSTSFFPTGPPDVGMGASSQRHAFEHAGFPSVGGLPPRSSSNVGHVRSSSSGGGTAYAVGLGAGPAAAAAQVQRGFGQPAMGGMAQKPGMLSQQQQQHQQQQQQQHMLQLQSVGMPPPHRPSPSPSSAFGPGTSFGHQCTPSGGASAGALDAPPALSDLGKGIPLHAVPPDYSLFIVQFKAGRVDLFYYFPNGSSGGGGGEDVEIRTGDLVIVEADRGKDLGTVINDSITIEEVQAFQAHEAEVALWTSAAAGHGQGGGMGDGASGLGGPGGRPGGLHKNMNPKRIYARATQADTSLLLSKAQDEERALQLIQTKVKQKRLPMEVVDVEYQWDRRKLTIYFRSEVRIDFRELVRELFRTYKTRIWCSWLPPVSASTNANAGASASALASVGRLGMASQTY